MKDYFYITKNNYHNLKDIKHYGRVEINYYPNNMDLILHDLDELKYLYVYNFYSSRTNIILYNLKNLSVIKINNSKINLILENNLSKFKLLYLDDEDVNILDKHNYLENLLRKELTVKRDNFIFDFKYLDITDINFISSNIVFELDNYPKLKTMTFFNIKKDLIISSNFPALKYFIIKWLDIPIENEKYIVNLNGSFFPVLENLDINEFSLKEFICDYKFSSLKIISLKEDIEKVIMFFSKKSNRLISFNTNKNTELSSDFLKIIPLNDKKNYNIKLPLKKNARNS